MSSNYYVLMLTVWISSSFDATYLYQYTFILLYNLVFTSLPVIVLGGASLMNKTLMQITGFN